MLLTYQMEVKAPIEEAFSYLEDNEKQKKWMQGLEGTEYLTTYDMNNPVGVKFIQRLKEGKRIQAYEGQVIEYDKNRILGVQLNHSQFLINVTYQLQEKGANHCMIYLREEVIAKSLGSKIMMMLFSPFMKKALKKQMNIFKQIVETSH